MRPRLAMMCVMLLLAVACQGQEQETQEVQPVSLRSQPDVLTEAMVLEMIETRGFAYPATNIKGTFVKSYSPLDLAGGRVVSEHASGLMWQHSESPRMNWRELQAYVEETNQAGHAGFSDWRVPTLEELASLLDARLTGDDYLDDVFSEEDLLGTWSADEEPDSVGGSWFLSFADGGASAGNRLAGLGHGRLVRTVSSARKT